MSYTPTEDTILFQWTIKAMKCPRSTWATKWSKEIETITWEVRRAGISHLPQDVPESLLASGEFDFSYQSDWKPGRLIEYTIHEPRGIKLTKGVEVCFVLRIDPEMAVDVVIYPFGWAYSSATYEPDEDYPHDSSRVLGSCNAGGWSAASLQVTLNLRVPEAQAGDNWHCIIDGKGYMQPSPLRGYRSQQIQGGLAQTRGGQSEYSQLRAPYSAMSQSSWDSGGGQLNYEDLHGYLFGENIDTRFPNQVILGPEVVATGTWDWTDGIAPGSSSLHMELPAAPGETGTAGLLGRNARYIRQRYIASATFTMKSLGILVSKMYEGNYSLEVRVLRDVAGNIGTPYVDWTPIFPRIGGGWEDVKVLYGWGFEIPAESAYWIEVRTTQPIDSGPPMFRVMMTAGPGPGVGFWALHSPDGGQFFTASSSWYLCFRVNGGVGSELAADVSQFCYGNVAGEKEYFCAAGANTYRWDEPTNQWRWIGSTAKNVTDMICFDGKLYVAHGLNAQTRTWNGSTWTDTGWAFTYLELGKGYLWASQTANTVRRSNNGVDWSSPIVVGEPHFAITGMINYAGRFLVGKQDGVWEIDDQDLAKEYTLFRAQWADNNCKNWTVWSGMLFMPIQSGLWRWVSTNYKVVGPNTERNVPVNGWAQKLTALGTTADALWASMDPVWVPDNSESYGGLLAYTGLGWHSLVRHSGRNEYNKAVMVATHTDAFGKEEFRVWFGRGARPCYITLPSHTANRYEWERARYATGGMLVSSWWDGGLKDALKYWNRLNIHADLPSGTAIRVYYAVDGQKWQDLEDLEYLTEFTQEDLAANGEYVAMFPDKLTAKSLQMVFVLTTNSPSVTPRLRAYNVECLIRQIPADAYTFPVLLGRRVTRMDGMTDSRTADEMWEDLRKARAKDYPILVSFPGRTLRCVITNLSESTADFKPEGTQEVVWDRIAQVSVIEAN